jgi:TPP-dependent 2-oxoacid decarboxylase
MNASTVAEYILRGLAEVGVSHLFAVSEDDSLHVLDHVTRRTRRIWSASEQLVAERARVRRPRQDGHG